MLKLKLDKITKTYLSGEEVIALKDVSLSFRESEFVAVLGPSGCGKTTLLNIIGGLDRYTSGDLIINGMSTKKFKDGDWDAYRNRSIGFVFQSYNLIGHQTVLQNVEIAMTLSGVSASERKRRAMEALAEVGIADQHKKKPNQLSGGQMQRVAIARALVNNPDIILADEPTGALDSQTSVQLMDILHEIAKTRLVIMVTHNGELAEKYSNRIVRLLDGSIQSDSNPVTEEEVRKGITQKTDGETLKKTAMSLSTATSLSFRNLLTKRGRTIMTAFAGSIGIIGVALVLALSAGLSTYMDSMQSSTLAGYPITITTGEQTIDFTQRPGADSENTTLAEYPNDNVLYAYDSEKNSTKHSNIITQDYLDYVGQIDNKLPDSVNTISYTQGVNINLLAKGKDTVVKFDTAVSFGGTQMNFLAGSNSYWGELPHNDDFILSLYDLMGEGSRLPTTKNEVVLVVDKYNRIDKTFFEKLGITEDTEKYKLTDFIGQTILQVIPNDDYYSKSTFGSLYTASNPSDYDSLYQSGAGTELTIVGILRPKEDSESSYLSPGIAYTTELTAAVVENAKDSEIAVAQNDSDRNVLFGTTFKDSKDKEAMLIMLGADTTPTGINIYPKNYSSKDEIKAYLDTYNDGKEEEDQLVYSDLAEAITSITKTLLSTITYVLVGFAAISLVVSTIMISIITYVSVIERTKEIGILRSVGARKKDISRVFNAETLLIGFSAGVLGVGLSYLLSLPINLIILNLTGITGIAALNPVHAVLLIVGSMFLTLIAGFIPSRMAAQKDPVIALRTE
jgi:putative ABC transport system permease protein